MLLTTEIPAAAADDFTFRKAHMAKLAFGHVFGIGGIPGFYATSRNSLHVAVGNIGNGE